MSTPTNEEMRVCFYWVKNQMEGDPSSPTSMLLTAVLNYAASKRRAPTMRALAYAVVANQRHPALSDVPPPLIPEDCPVALYKGQHIVVPEGITAADYISLLHGEGFDGTIPVPHNVQTYLDDLAEHPNGYGFPPQDAAFYDFGYTFPGDLTDGESIERKWSDPYSYARHLRWIRTQQRTRAFLATIRRREDTRVPIDELVRAISVFDLNNLESPEVAPAAEDQSATDTVPPPLDAEDAAAFAEIEAAEASWANVVTQTQRVREMHAGERRNMLESTGFLADTQLLE
ncbi:hypothetical protein C8R43DRAFT_965608 [Mycena crocata]|nr:hypothetical protein C8R43DRAFT_965608 [Mycena crocata]